MNRQIKESMADVDISLKEAKKAEKGLFDSLEAQVKVLKLGTKVMRGYLNLIDDHEKGIKELKQDIEKSKAILNKSKLYRLLYGD